MVNLSQIRALRRGGVAPRKSLRESGFTLLELIIVMTIIAILAGIAIPAYLRNVRAAKEAVLKADLHVMRNAIESYTVDKAQAPQSLQDLVQAGYLKSMPVDPMTHSTEWGLRSNQDDADSDSFGGQNVFDVYTKSQGTALDGTKYSTW